jgi:hypothetical protein
LIIPPFPECRCDEPPIPLPLLGKAVILREQLAWGWLAGSAVWPPVRAWLLEKVAPKGALSENCPLESGDAAPALSLSLA